MTSPVAIVKKALQAYVDKDRAAIEALIGDDYKFTSPLDNQLSRKTYFERCWPNSTSITGMTLVNGVNDGERAWVVYEGSTAQKRFRNAEVHIVRGDKIVDTQVYFGWDLPHKAPPGGFVSADDER
jgi:ketosteroid isomerase-like protein